MFINEMFKMLGAPLKSQRQSWGAVRQQDGAVFLRVWQNDICVIDGEWRIWVADASGLSSKFAHKERLSHVELIRSGSPSYLVIVRPDRSDPRKQRIAGFNTKTVFVGGALAESGGCVWLTLADRIPVHAARL